MSDPNLVISGLSRQVSVEGHEFQIDIYRIETEPKWSLEVVDEERTSIVWDDLFDTDQAALDEILKSIKEEGLAAFQDSGNVVSFPGR
jgi:hypothetical protein